LRGLPPFGYSPRMSSVETTGRTVQLHLVMPYKQQPRDHPSVRSHLERGFRIVQLQRISDREAVVTLAGSD
jgi:hypothetical protein